MKYSQKELEWIKTYMKIAKAFSEHSKCRRLKVGAVIVKNGRIISTGYNGTPKGLPNCCDVFKEEDAAKPEFMDRHGLFSKHFELHAELNAILYAQREHMDCVDSDIYVTTAPCSDCAKIIVTAGIKKAFYLNKYDRDENGPELLSRCGVDMVWLRDPKFNSFFDDV
jgi:dCMP deaminase